MEITSNINYFEEFILKNISLGSGINCKWNFDYTEKRCKLSNSYQVLSEYGFYMGFIDFTISFPVICINENIIFSMEGIRDNFKLTFQTNSRGYYWIDKLDLRTYLDDLFYYDFDNMVEIRWGNFK